MNIKLLIGIWIALIIIYLLFRKFTRSGAATAAYRREIHHLMTNKKYHVKGKFE